MSEDTVVKLVRAGTFTDQLTEILRSGARALLTQAVEAEVAEFLAKHSDLKTEGGFAASFATGICRRARRYGLLQHMAEASDPWVVHQLAGRRPLLRCRGVPLEILSQHGIAVHDHGAEFAISEGCATNADPAMPQGQGRPLDQEAWQELLRLQEPHQRRRPAQADPGLRRDRCVGPRQPEPRRAFEQGQHLGRRLRRQRLPLGPNRGEAESARLAQPHPCPRQPQPPAATKAQQAANKVKSKISVRIEHVFGAQQNARGGRLVRTIGIVRAKARIGLDMNLVYNIRRLVTLQRIDRQSPQEQPRQPKFSVAGTILRGALHPLATWQSR